MSNHERFALVVAALWLPLAAIWLQDFVRRCLGKTRQPVADLPAAGGGLTVSRSN